MPTPVLIAGSALTPFGRSEEPLLELLVKAGEMALENAGVDRKKVDAVYLGAMNPEEFTGQGNLPVALADGLGVEGAASSRVETASSTGAGALESAFFAVASGYKKTVLVVAGEKMTGLSTGAATKVLAEVIDPTERRYGASMPALAALVAKVYAKTYGLDPSTLKQAMGKVAMKNHARGALNPLAQFRREITTEKYGGSRLVADPLGLYDCAPITDGAAGMVLSAKKGSVRLAGMGHATDSSAVSRRGSLVSFNSTRQAAKAAYDMARVKPGEIDFAEVHDAFTIFEIIGTEDLGLFRPGKGWQAAMNGETAPDGAMPINPSGGLKARGHPVGASGLAQVVEAHWLLTGKVEPARRLPKEPKIALTQSIGGLGNNNLVTILVPAERPLYPKGRWQSPYDPEIVPLSPAPPEPLPQNLLARVVSCTRLNTPPEGFQAPLDLVLARAKGGWMTLAHWQGGGEPPKQGMSVELEMTGGLYLAGPAPGLGEALANKAGRAIRKFTKPSQAGGTGGAPKNGSGR